jgi:type I restriction enzyme S subunit
MNAERLLEHYEKIAEAPDAIPKLRRFILDLAIRGKLVPQDPSDEPAEELLKRIEAEKKKLINSKSVRKCDVEGLARTDAPFRIPNEWVWTRLGTIGDWGSGSTPSRANADFYGGPITWLKSGELNDCRNLKGSEETISRGALETGSFRLNQPGDVLFAMYGATIGKVAILAEEAVTNQAVCGCTPYNGVSSEYLFFFLISQREQFHGSSRGGAQPNTSKIKLVATPFPLPPLAEQQRIVAKVDELMGICDRLEGARKERESIRDDFTTSTLGRLSVADESTFRSDASFAIKHLRELTTRPDQIKQLRQTILNLAVRGKLVPQDSNDEPAAELLKRIAAEKSILIKSGEIKEKPRQSDAIEVWPYALPRNWVWVRLSSLAQTITKGSSPKWQGVSYVNEGAGLLFITSENVGNYKLRKLDELKFVENRFRDIEPRSMLKRGDLLINLVGASIGRTAIYDLEVDANINQAVGIIRLVAKAQGPLVQYLLHYLNSQTAINLMLGMRVTTAQPNMSLTDVKEFPIPLPPFPEQHRIVAKIDQSLKLCDHLESRLDLNCVISEQLMK